MDMFLNWVNANVLRKYDTILVGGFAEPYFLAANNGHLAEIRFTHDYYSSALHELAHWCIAGCERLRQNDFGYWYVPTGRSSEEQEQFYQAEVKPQAVEKAFTMLLGIEFNFSHDNIGTKVGDGERFARKVEAQYRNYLQSGFPPRAQLIMDGLKSENSYDKHLAHMLACNS